MIRVSRQMNKLQVSKRFGDAYGGSSTPGMKAIFCPSCPQPGINLPPHWLIRRTITADGNFHADHIRMRRPDQDVTLTNGDTYMAETEKYMECLSVAKEQPVVSI